MTVALLAVTLLLGQAQPSIWGTVRDSETGALVVGARIEILDADRVSITDSAGSYFLGAVEAGAWHLRVSGFGYTSRTLHVFVPAQGGVRVDVALEPEPIPVPAVGASLAARPGAGASELAVDRFQPVGSRSVTAWDVRSHPGLAAPDFLEALGGQGVRLDPESPSGLHAHGGESDQNLFLLDGVPVYSPYHTAGQFSAFNPEALSRVDLHSVVAPPAWDGALSAVVDARSETPGADAVTFRGAVTATGARLAADGSLPLGAGALVSAGWGRPGFLVPSSEESYVWGSFSDALAKLEAPLGGGRLRALAFTSENDLGAASASTSDEGSAPESAQAEPADPQARNQFSWSSRSYGLSWEGPLGGRAALAMRLWRADLGASSNWQAAGGPLSLSSERRSYGSELTLQADGPESGWRIGLSAERDRTHYAVAPDDSSSAATDSLLRVTGEADVLAAFAEHRRSLGDRVQVMLGLRGNFVAGARPRWAARLAARWPVSSLLAVSAGYSRSHQWVQSLRNPESLIGPLFSPSLSVAAGANGVPIARSDHFGLALEVRPAQGVSAGLSGYARFLEGLVLVAPATGQPFAVAGHSVGRGRAWGGGANVDLVGARYRALLDYGFSAVAYDVSGESYRPGFAVSHSLAASLGYSPSATLALRAALRVEFGRPATAFEGPFESEACSFIEGGCEAVGSPEEVAGPLGGERLPAYARLDVGVRKSWQWQVLGRDALLTGFMSLSNVFGRRNFSGLTVDPSTGALTRLPMRPFSPLTAGLEWSF